MSTLSISVSDETHQALEAFLERSGLEGGDVVEAALQMYLKAHAGLPDEAFIPGRLKLGPRASRTVAQEILTPPEPNEALKKLARGR